MLRSYYIHNNNTLVHKQTRQHFTSLQTKPRFVKAKTNQARTRFKGQTKEVLHAAEEQRPG